MSPLVGMAGLLALGLVAVAISQSAVETVRPPRPGVDNHNWALAVAIVLIGAVVFTAVVIARSQA